MHAALRDAGPGRAPDAVRPLRVRPLRARCTPRSSTGRSFQSAAGVGLSNFRYEKPWRPPSLLLEADPPQHDAPRRVLQQDPRPAGAAQAPGRLARRRRRARRPGARRRHRVRRRAAPGRRLPAAGVPGRRRHRARTAGRTCCPTATTRSTRSARRNDLVAKGGAARRRSCRPGSSAQCQREALADGRIRRRDLGGVRPRRHHPRAGAAGRPLAAHGRRRHDGARHLRRPVRLRDQPRPVAAAARANPRSPGLRSTRRSAGSRRCRRSSGRRPRDVRVGDARRPRGAQDPHVPGRRPTATRAAGTNPDASTSPATRPATSASAWASTSASASTSPGWRPRR